MSALVVCDQCRWKTWAENTSSTHPPGRVAHAFLPAPVRGCGCLQCYRGRWTHARRPALHPALDPDPWRYIVFGNDGGINPWEDFCPQCAPPAGWLVGLPWWWKLGRMLFVLAAALGSIALWAHLFVRGSE